jgi:hypothetical protein
MFWRNIGHEIRHRPISVAGNFENDMDGNDPSAYPREEDYYSTCSAKLVVRRSDNTKLCPECGWTLQELLQEQPARYPDRSKIKADSTNLVSIGEVPYSDDDGVVISNILDKANIRQHLHPNYESLDGRSCMRWNCTVPGCEPLKHTHDTWNEKIAPNRLTRYLLVGEPIDSEKTKINDERQYIQTEIVDLLGSVLTAVQSVAAADDASRMSEKNKENKK